MKGRNSDIAFRRLTQRRFSERFNVSWNVICCCPAWWQLRRAGRSSGLVAEGLELTLKLASMLHREHVCIEIGNPLLALLGDAKVAQGISDIRSDRLPEEIWIVCSQIRNAIVFQFVAHSCLAKLVE